MIPAVLNHGSDPFRFALVWAIGFECLSRPDFRAEQSVAAAWTDLSAWIRDEADLASFDGTMDVRGRGLGLFDEFLGRRAEEGDERGLDAAKAWLLASMPIAMNA